ncbi:hypothetical protein MRB53_040651 [Persea americana]|nr:hypothetical protein MRB53_040651 [Persea americana]
MASSQNASSKRQARNRSDLAIAACDRCRRSKLRCDGGRPSCTRCINNGIDVCHYGTNVNESRIQARQRRHQEMESLRGLLNDSLVWLASQSSETVTACLQQISKEEDPISALCSTVTTQQLDVSLQSSSSYPWISPLDCLFTNPSTTDASVSHDGKGVISAVSLDDLNIGFWTTVPISNRLAADLLRTYCRVEHPIYAFFDWNLFCQDLLSRQTRFCSPLLLNSNTFSPLFPEAISYIDAFAYSTQLLLGAEQNVQSEINVASFMLLAMSNICLGENDLAKRYMIAGISMAESLHLMGQDRYELQQFGEMHPHAQEMLKHVAWGAFNVQVYCISRFLVLMS